MKIYCPENYPLVISPRWILPGQIHLGEFLLENSPPSEFSPGKFSHNIFFNFLHKQNFTGKILSQYFL